MTLKEHHSARMKKARTTARRVRRLAGQIGLCPNACRRTLVQASALYGAELWSDDQEGAGVKNQRDELQRLENQLGMAVTGSFRTTNLGVVMAESGLRPAECLLSNRSQHHVLRLMSLPKGARPSPSRAATRPWDSVWSTLASTPVGWRRYIYRRTGQRSSRRASPSPTQGGRSRRR